MSVEAATKAIDRLRSLRADSPEDVRFIAEAIDSVALAHRPRFAAFLVWHKLMIVRPWQVRFALWALAKRNNPIERLEMFFKLHPADADRMVEGAADWVLNGRDATTPRSCGGWNQEEVNVCVRVLLLLAVEAKRARS